MSTCLQGSDVLPLGRGSFGVVSKCVHKDTKEERAVKVMSKKRMTSLEPVRAEIEVMEGLNHPNIIRLYETFEDDHDVMMIIELFVARDGFWNQSC
jgi:calcium-dependent protein kinase